MYIGLPIKSTSAEFFRWWISTKRQPKHFGEEPGGQSPQMIENFGGGLGRGFVSNCLTRRRELAARTLLACAFRSRLRF
jgi:hypothetical protein